MFRSAQNVDGAIDEIVRWADSLPGDFTVEVSDYDDGTAIEITGTLISSGLVLHAWLHLNPALELSRYRFHVQHGDGLLLWRQDRHPGHEDAPGMRGPEHVHRLRAGREVRLPADPIDLVGLRDALVEANVEHAT